MYEMKQQEQDIECVFQPTLVAHSNRYNNFEENSFLLRNEAWKEQRDNKLISQRQNKITHNLTECTFQPAINNTKIPLSTQTKPEDELDFV